MKNQIHFLGRSKGKNSLILSTIAIDINGKRIVIDPGKGIQSPSTEDEDTQTFTPDVSSICDGNKINRIMSTHGHMDHISYTPALCGAKGLVADDAEIWSTPQTNKILDMTAWDDLDKGTKDFDHLQYFDMIGRLHDIPGPGENVIDGEAMYMIPNGHMPGSTSFMFRMPTGRVFLFLGDYCRHDQASVGGGFTPNDIPEEWVPDEMTTDLTYASSGMIEEKSYEEKKLDLLQAVTDSLQLGKTVVIQGFASSKIPNIAHELAALNIPCWIDSKMAWKILDMFHKIRWSDKDSVLLAPGDDIGICRIGNSLHREELMTDGQPKAILATGGMGDFGPILEWYEYGLPRMDFAFFATSYLAPGSNGARLVELGNGENRIARLKIKKRRDEKSKWKNIPVGAEIQRFGLSSHGTFVEFIEFLKEMIDRRSGRPLERIFLVHGTEDAMGIAQRELKMFAKEVIDPNKDLKDNKAEI